MQVQLFQMRICYDRAEICYNSFDPSDPMRTLLQWLHRSYNVVGKMRPWGRGIAVLLPSPPQPSSFCFRFFLLVSVLGVNPEVGEALDPCQVICFRFLLHLFSIPNKAFKWLLFSFSKKQFELIYWFKLLSESPHNSQIKVWQFYLLVN